jgi:hypothetical protein
VIFTDIAPCTTGSRLATNPTEQCAQKRGWWLDSIAATAWTPPCGTHTALPLCLWPAVAMDPQMGGDDDDEYEDLYVVLELPEVHSSFLSSCETYSLIGLDSPTPILKLGSAVFRGSHEDALGTHLVFSDAEELASLPTSARLPAPTRSGATARAGAAAAPPARSRQHLIAQTTQKICFERVLLEPRQAEQGTGQGNEQGQQGQPEQQEQPAATDE